MKTLEFYNAFLLSLGCVINKDSTVSWGDIPISVSKRRLVMPTTDILKNPSWDDQIAFHPLSESSTGKLSPVMQRMIKIMELTLHEHYLALAEALLMMAGMKELSSKISPKDVPGIASIPELDEEDVAFLRRQLDNAEEEGLSFAKFSVVTDVAIGNENYKRGVRVKSPLFRKLKEDPERCITAKYGKRAKTRQKALIAIMDLMIGERRGEIIPEYEETNYTSATSTLIVPIFTCALRTYAQMLEHIKSISARYSKVLRKIESPLLEANLSTDWIDYVEHFKTMKSEIPPLSGNYAQRDSDAQTMGGETAAPRKIQAFDQPGTALTEPAAPKPEVPSQQTLVSTAVSNAQEAPKGPLTLEQMRRGAAVQRPNDIGSMMGMIHTQNQPPAMTMANQMMYGQTQMPQQPMWPQQQQMMYQQMPQQQAMYQQPPQNYQASAAQAAGMVVTPEQQNPYAMNNGMHQQWPQPNMQQQPYAQRSLNPNFSMPIVR